MSGPSSTRIAPALIWSIPGMVISRWMPVTELSESVLQASVVEGETGAGIVERPQLIVQEDVPFRIQAGGQGVAQGFQMTTDVVRERGNQVRLGFSGDELVARAWRIAYVMERQKMHIEDHLQHDPQSVYNLRG